MSTDEPISSDDHARGGPPALPSEFTFEGLLEPGDYVMTLDELRESILVKGPKRNKSKTWDEPWRARLVDNLATLARQLWSVGVSEIYVNGSFAEDKDHPNDIDGYFVCDAHQLISGQLQVELNLLDAHKIWTWRPELRRPYRGFPKLQLPMWHVYRVELYPHIAGMGCGIHDKYGNELEFPSAFRISRRNDNPKGIVRLEGHHDS